MAEYSGTEAANQAEAALPGIVPVAVAYYKDEGDKNFRAGEKTQFGVPQSQGREYFEKMYREDPTGAQADYAFLMWNRALGTEGKTEQAIGQLQEFANKFPESSSLAQALFTLGFLTGAAPMQKYSEGVKWLQQVIEKYPNDELASEALWHSALFAEADNKPDDAIGALQQLQQKYPQSPRYPYAMHWIEELEKTQ